MTKKRGRPPKTSATSSPTAISSSTGTRSETTLFCLVHKNLQVLFSQLRGGHESVAGLRKLIKKGSEPYLDDFAPWQLRLWVVDIPLNSPNLGMGVLHPNKVGDIFTTQPNENNIHIIVELPTSPSAEDQKDFQGSVIKRGHMNYLSDNISISSTLVWYDPKSKNEPLNVSDVSLPFDISGTTDVLVMNKSFYNVLDYCSGIRAGFELKKRELIATNILSNFAVFFVLTDLNDCWIFYWLSNDRTVMMFRAIDSSNALDIIERTLDEDSISTATTTIDPNFPIGSRINFCHLGNLQGEASENVDLFFNRPKVQFEFEDDVANMKDMFDEMTEEEIKGWKVRRVLKLFG
ncbi:hypothetical protein RhiirA4_544379 [Rhizophagus irregularis]|uniref:Crinkler effector protein N-terminal domain-containing protein n=1 Tax=Rhizophagus irregularis TaxID=588596 RepID=A0A2I1GN34_9GLOM|nr:hypothetical protein RhiirA4_544379 [Rhizophagus irregularis]